MILTVVIIASETSTIEEVDELESTLTGDDSMRLSSINDLNNCKLFTIFEDNENSFELPDVSENSLFPKKLSTLATLDDVRKRE